jgi:hypothetical protein
LADFPQASGRLLPLSLIPLQQAKEKQLSCRQQLLFNGQACGSALRLTQVANASDSSLRAGIDLAMLTDLQTETVFAYIRRNIVA